MVCFVGPLPPPQHGMAKVNEMVIERLRDRTKVSVIDIAAGSEKPGVVAKLRRIWRIGAALPRLALCRATGARVAYGSVDDGSGGFLTVIWVAAAKLFGHRVYLHHHSFRYLLEPTLPMRVLTRVAGSAAEHIVLCPRMEMLLRELYPSVCQVHIVPNAVPIPDKFAASPGNRPLTIGLLSNLTFEKGVGRFLEILRVLRSRDIEVRGVLAGPATSAEVETAIIQAKNELGEWLDWVGSVSGESKEAFFKAIDFFIFPTNYKTEAYPLVVIEALVHGVPVFATNQGCLEAFATLESVTIVPRQEAFVNEALSFLETQSRGLELRTHSRAVARRNGVQTVTENNRQLDKLLNRLLIVQFDQRNSDLVS